MSKRVLIACERSQVECCAFRDAGFLAYSMDIEPCYGGFPEWHIVADAYDFPLDGWDLIIAHPPCTELTHANNARRHLPGRVTPIVRALRLWARFLFEAPCPVAVENPVGIPNEILPANQIICPSMFGEPYRKRTCLWLRGLPPLLPTCHVLNAVPWVDSSKYTGAASSACPGLGRSAARSKSFVGVARAMASQWGSFIREIR